MWPERFAGRTAVIDKSAVPSCRNAMRMRILMLRKARFQQGVP